MYAAASEDMDTITFSSPILLRHLTFSEQKKMPINEVILEKVLEGLELTMDQVSGRQRHASYFKCDTTLDINLITSSSTCVFCSDVIMLIVSKELAHIEPSTWSKNTNQSKRLSLLFRKSWEKTCHRIGNMMMRESYSEIQRLLIVLILRYVSIAL